MRRLTALSLTLLLAGCATAPGPNCERLAAAGWFCLLPPSALAPRSGTDLVTVTRSGKSEHYLGQLAVTPAGLTLALSSLGGVPLATVTWDGRTARVRPRKSPLQPGLLTALLELTLAPPAALSTALHGLHIAVRDSPAGSERRLTADHALVAVATSNPQATEIRVPRARLVVTLEPVGDAAK